MGQLLLGPREVPEQVQTRRVPDAAAVATAITELAERLHNDERERENIMPLNPSNLFWSASPKAWASKPTPLVWCNSNWT